MFPVEFCGDDIKTRRVRCTKADDEKIRKTLSPNALGA